MKIMSIIQYFLHKGMPCILSICLMGGVVIQANGRLANCRYKVIADWPHAEHRFTQGLYWQDGWILESVGGYGKSRLIKQQFPEGTVRYSQPLWPSEFAEDITVVDGKVYQLSWKAGKLLVYNQKNLQPMGNYRYQGQGWGLTHTEQFFIRSDGSHCVFYHDLSTFKQIKKRCLGEKAYQLNALAYEEGVLYANDFLKNRLLRIQLETMMVLDYIDLQRLKSGKFAGVANGVTIYKPGQIIVTGKNWNKLYLLDTHLCRAITSLSV